MRHKGEQETARVLRLKCISSSDADKHCGQAKICGCEKNYTWQRKTCVYLFGSFIIRANQSLVQQEKGDISWKPRKSGKVRKKKKDKPVTLAVAITKKWESFTYDSATKEKSVGNELWERKNDKQQGGGLCHAKRLHIGAVVGEGGLRGREHKHQPKNSHTQETLI